MKRFLSLAAISAIAVSSAFAADDMAAMKAELNALKSQIEELKKAQSENSVAEMAKQIKELKVRTGGDNVKWDIDYRTSIDSLKYNMIGNTPTTSTNFSGMNTLFTNIGAAYTGGATTAATMNTAMGGYTNFQSNGALASFLTASGAMNTAMSGLASDSIVGQQTSKASNPSLLEQRLVLGMKAAPSPEISFIGKLSLNKAFGDTANHAQSNTTPGFANFDWVASENALDSNIRLKEAYAIYFGNLGDVPYTASIGRRPSYDGAPGNMREGNANANSPLSHMINVEYDGASFLFNLEKVTGVPGMSWKLCMGRGLTNAVPRFDMMHSGADYSKDSALNANVDLAGFIFVPYDNGQYSVHSMFFRAMNMIGFKQSDISNFQTAYGRYYSNIYDRGMDAYNLAAGTASASTTYYQSADGLNNLAINAGNLKFQNVGDLDGATAYVMANGIGTGLGDFADNTTAFVSFAMSKTHPSAAGGGMLGSDKSEMGTSWYAGVQMPFILTETGKLGLEMNKGSKYWRSVTHGEDTMVGSKLAARGTALEAYWNQPLLKNLDMQVRYTKIDYDYTGSNSFFGAEGTPRTMTEAAAAGLNAVKSATDIRAYLRYKY